MSQNVAGLINESKKKLDGLINYIRQWNTSANKPHNTIGKVLYQVLGQVNYELTRIPPNIVNSQAETVLSYNLLDLRIVLTRTDELVRKAKDASSSFFGKLSKYLDKIAFMCKLLYGIFYLISSLFCTPQYPISVPYVFCNKEAEQFWTKNVGSNIWYAEYPKFTACIKALEKKAGAVLESNSDTTKIFPQVVTAIRFSFMADVSFKAFVMSLAKENPFLIPSSVVQPGPTSSQMTDVSSVAIETGKTSEYFYIVSACVGDETNVCVQAQDRDPGSNIVIGELNYSDAQQWKWEENGSLINRMTKLAIDIDGREPKSGKKLVQWPADGSATQMWLIGIDGYIHSGPALEEPLCFDLDGGNTTHGTPCLLWNIIPNRPNQLWRILPATETSYDN